jgi:hypothetical protein
LSREDFLPGGVKKPHMVDGLCIGSDAVCDSERRQQLKSTGVNSTRSGDRVPRRSVVNHSNDNALRRQ